MMIEPPIDELVKIAGCRYALVCLISKRARTLLENSANSDIKPVAYAAHELYTKKIGCNKD
jgi:DNA-directed RNA polymerase omega subunit